MLEMKCENEIWGNTGLSSAEPILIKLHPKDCGILCWFLEMISDISHRKQKSEKKKSVFLYFLIKN